MEYIKFGKEGKKVSKVVLGLMRTSNMDVDSLSAFTEAALDEGINFFDNADCYGNGRAEELLGLVFEKNPALRNKVFLQSKCGIRIDSDFTWYDFSKEYILSAVDNILSRLKTDHLDSLLLHRPDALMEADEIAEAFTKLEKEGKVLNFGVSNQNPMMMKMLLNAGISIVVNQVQLSCAFTPAFNAGFNVNMQNPASIMHDGGIFEFCRANDIGIQAWSGLQYGFFEGTFLGSEKYVRLNQVLERIAYEKGCTPSAVALAWIMRYPGKTQAVTGTANIQHMKECAKAADIQLSKKEWYEIYLSAGNTLP
ncbi:MAG: aldo/keto reductase [Treponema sp.]|nr:aldo/keto reductase [Treponema sp.]